MPKKPKTSTKDAKSAVETPWEVGSAAALRVICSEIVAIESDPAPCKTCGLQPALPGTKSRGDRVAQLAHKAAGIAAEQRKANAAALKLTETQVETWLFAQPLDYRATLARRLVEVDSHGKGNPF